MSELRPTSAAGYAAFTDGRLPAPEEIDGDTLVVAVPMPAGGIVSSTLCYVLRDRNGAAHILDPGWNTDENAALLRHAVESWGIRRIASVIVSHLHEDHLGMAQRIRDATGAMFVMADMEWQTHLARTGSGDRSARYDAWGVPADKRPRYPTMPPGALQHPTREPELMVRDGDVLALGRDVEAVLTPGHTQGSLTLRDAERRQLFTGDHLLPHVHPGVGLDYATDADPIGDYLESLERIRAFDGDEVLPGHGYRFAALEDRIDRTTDHHLRRARQVADALEQEQDLSVWELASRLTWTHGWDRLEGYFLNSALQQTAMHARFVADTARSARWLERSRAAQRA
ncbi:Glyoxylase, beta-lactamase superfamily II [Agrococcus baldri]|uniref:Glyoxylase, beta-lactamase superfamily II n=1 Tax=Agrococcus baldri TaxID=153730 RepID=A0AA94HNJ8_9MICO|nr:MBL fold metallo-hydrolase [Agrococcus baldri]SFS11546.1 Glyoxylase, beta-lactamase superfamily II [Agrococcus baldri]